MKYKLITMVALAASIAACNSGSENNGSGTGTNMANGSALTSQQLSSYSAVCLLKGGIVSITDNIPSKLARGTTSQIKINVHCANGTAPDVTSSSKFSVLNSNILTVDKNGLITTSLLGGNTQITYSYNGGIPIAQSISIVDSKMRNLSLHTDATAFNAGESIEVKAYADFEDDSEDKDFNPALLEWSSSNAKIATVQKGVVKLLAAGSTDITAKYSGQGVERTATYKLIVGSAVLKDLQITPEVIDLIPSINSEVQVAANAVFSDKSTTKIASDSLTCTSANEKVAKFKNNCLLELTANAKTSDTTEITVKYKDQKASKTVVVGDGSNISELDVKAHIGGMLPGGEPRDYQIFAKAGTASYDVTDSLVLTSNNPDIVKVDGGKIIPIKAGDFTLSTEYKNSAGKVIKGKTGGVVGTLDVDWPSAALVVDDEYPIKVSSMAYGLRIDMTSSVKITSSNANVLVVDNKLIAKNTGNATITVTVPDHKITLTKDISIVNGNPQDIRIVGAPDSIKLGNNAELSLNAIYKNGREIAVTNSAVAWSTPTSDIVSISADGVLKPLKIGVGKIVAKYDGKEVTNAVNVDAADLKDLVVAPNPITIFRGEIVYIYAKAWFTDNSSTLINIKDLKCAVPDGTGLSISPDGCNVLGGGIKADGETTLTVTYDSKTVAVPVEMHKALTPAKNIYLSKLNTLFVGQNQYYNLTYETTGGKNIDVTSEIPLVSDKPSILKVGINGALQPLAPGQVKLSVTYDGKTYVNEYVQVLRSEIVKTNIELVDSNNRVADNNQLMPHEEYTVKVKSCVDKFDNTLPAQDCEVKFSQKTSSGAANLSGMKLTPLLAGEVVLHDDITNADYKFNVAPIRNPEYETSAGSFSSKFTKVVVSDEKAGNGYNISHYTADNQRSLDLVKENLEAEGRYGVVSGPYNYHTNAVVSWIDFNFNETNRPIKMYYNINHDTQCSTQNGVWSKDGKFAAAPFGSNVNMSNTYSSDCVGGGMNVQKNVWHNGDAVRVFYQ